MKIKSIELESFKKINKAELVIDNINVIVGSNNAGKSSILQGIHFSVVTAVTARRLDKRTFTQDNVLFCPTKSFVKLRNGWEYQNQSNFGFLRIRGEIDNNEDLYTIKVYRGRNDGNVGCERSGNQTIGNLVTDVNHPFSIYVPGLAGIPQIEEYRSESVIRKGVASGDANLYLRNVLYLIEKKGLLDELVNLMKLIFPSFSLVIHFDPVHDSYIDVSIEGRQLELVGTGILQALQIFSYVTLFKPVLLLLDEPDSHLHPDNQGLLSDSLITLTQQTNTKIIISTHSRHMVDSLYGEANFIWLKNGGVFEQGNNLPRLPMLMDIGALDSFEKLREGQIEYVILSEDTHMDALKLLVKSSGFELDDVLFFSYKTSTNLVSAGILVDFIKEIAPSTKIIVHIDNDFFTNEEQRLLETKISGYGAIPFVTEGSDIESYFISHSHVAALLDVDVSLVEEWFDTIAVTHHNELVHKFSRKRDNAKTKLYRHGETSPDTINLIGNSIPLSCEQRMGKFMLKKVRANMHEKFGKTVNLLVGSNNLRSEKLASILNM